VAALAADKEEIAWHQMLLRCYALTSLVGVVRTMPIKRRAKLIPNHHRIGCSK
jgi:hypothetical protein